jgi:hypothetical protein
MMPVRLNHCLPVLLLLVSVRSAMAIEPLRGPEVGQDWRRNPDENDDQETPGKSRERYLKADIPIPMALGPGMPFLTMRYRDHVNTDQLPTFVSDQKIGVGMLHHAAEGDPAWRAEVSRVGSFSSQPATWSRCLFNLAKTYPSLKLEAADELASWIGVNAVSDDRGKTLWFPEFAWIRAAHDGTVIDFAAPGRFFIGLRGTVFGVFAGAEQQLLRWTDSHKSNQTTRWILRRESALKIQWFIRDEYTLTARIAREMNKTSNLDETSAGISMQWIPNP